MDKKTIILGICIVIASAILSGTLLYVNLLDNAKDRYKVVGNRVFDTREGKFVEAQNSKEVLQESDMQNSNIQILDSTTIKFYVKLPREGNNLGSLYSANTIEITIENLSDKYVISYLETDIKLYKDDVVFLKDTIIVGNENTLNGQKKAVNINPLSSYETIYHMDPNITYPDQPWTVKFATNTVKGFPIN